jgi:hypothetical protein
MEMRPMRRKSFLPWRATVLLTASCLSAGWAAAEVRISGTPDRVVLQTNDATMPDILAAIRSALNLEVNVRGSTGRRFTGVYAGSLRHVLARLLKGEDYIIGSASDGVSIRLLGRSAADSAARSQPITTAARAAPVSTADLPEELVRATRGSHLVALRQARGVTVDEP